MRRISVSVDGALPREIPAGTAAMAVVPAVAANGLPVLAALVNNEVVSLSAPLEGNCTVSSLTLADEHGWRVYRWSLSFILAKAAHNLFPEMPFRVRHSLGGGLYCNVEWPADMAATPAAGIERLAREMRRIVEMDLPVELVLVSYEDALRRFTDTGQADKLNLLRHRNPPQVVLADCGGFLDLHQEPILHRTGLLRLFELTPYEPGFVLQMPSREQPDRIPPLDPQTHLFHIYQEHIAWGRILGITTVGELNEAILAQRAEDVIMTVEALHDKKLARIAEQIASCRPGVRLVLVAGPSSAGKTTFSKRLLMHLRVNGLRPFLVSTDDYFVGDERNPRDEQGNLDYEHIDAMDLPRLNHDLEALLAGRPVHLPSFDFKSKSRRDRPEAVQLAADDVIVMEGIHCLNPVLTAQIPREIKFQIYISALTQLAIDHNSRISTTDNRLLRRLVRDRRFRGHSPLTTLRRWPSVQRGEQRWIFPFQHLADATFNSALDYELAVLKPYAVPLLTEIKPGQPEYAEARRLTGFLRNFMAIRPDVVPGDSILREYIGGSQLRY